jgi:hypothetical protein
MLASTVPNPDLSSVSSDALPRELAELQAKAQAAEIEAMARWTFESRLADMGETVAVFDAKRRASRWANHQRRKYRKVAYTFGFVISYSTHKKDASWKWLAARYRELHDERIGESTFRRLANEMKQLGLLEITENFQEPHGDGCVCSMCEYPGTQRWNTYTVHVGLAVGNNGELAVHDWNAPLADVQERVLVECQQCGNGFDPKRPDARYCSPRCRKAASRARDVTHNEHPGEHLPEHLGEHPIHFPNTSENSSSSSPLHGAGDDDRADIQEDSGERPSQPSIPPSPKERAPRVSQEEWEDLAQSITKHVLPGADPRRLAPRLRAAALQHKLGQGDMDDVIVWWWEYNAPVEFGLWHEDDDGVTIMRPDRNGRFTGQNYPGLAFSKVDNPSGWLWKILPDLAGAWIAAGRPAPDEDEDQDDDGADAA